MELSDHWATHTPREERSPLPISLDPLPPLGKRFGLFSCKSNKIFIFYPPQILSKPQVLFYCRQSLYRIRTILRGTLHPFISGQTTFLNHEMTSGATATSQFHSS